MWSIGKEVYQGTCTVYAFLCVVPILIPLVFTHTTTYSIFELVPWWTIQIFFMFSPCYMHSTGIAFKMNSFKFFICDLFVVHSLFLYMPRYILIHVCPFVSEHSSIAIEATYKSILFAIRLLMYCLLFFVAENPPTSQLITLTCTWKCFCVFKMVDVLLILSCNRLKSIYFTFEKFS